jgi:hypothetical protein
VGPRAVLDTVVRGKIPNPHQESNPRTPIVQPIRNQNCIHEEIKSRLNMGNAWYHSVQSLSSYLPSKIFKIKIYKTIILFCMGVKLGLSY